MVGSWAGAMGHTQFMPSAYAKYAVDGDGDGKADLWNSTTGRADFRRELLQHLGWQRNERWGREVLLPKDFSYSHLGQISPLALSGVGCAQCHASEWSTFARRGYSSRVVFAYCRPYGPAFLGYENFNVIMRWNRSGVLCHYSRASRRSH